MTTLAESFWRIDDLSDDDNDDAEEDNINKDEVHSDDDDDDTTGFADVHSVLMKSEENNNNNIHMNVKNEFSNALEKCTTLLNTERYKRTIGDVEREAASKPQHVKRKKLRKKRKNRKICTS